jgi:serine phosphatase RsbU (regulator of sigma subunit)/Tfp pilus assembly protein PilF
MKKIVFILLLIIISSTTKASIGYIDSLIKNKPDTERIVILKNFINNSDSLPLVMEAKQILATLYRKSGNYEKWYETYVSLAEDYKKIDFFKVVKTLKHLEKELTTTIKNDTLLASLYKKFGRIYEEKNNYEKAGQYYLKDLKISRKLKNKREVASALNSLGLIYYYQGNYDLALKNFKEALPLVEQLKFDYGIASILSNMGIIYFYQNKLDTAEQTYLKVLELDKKLNDRYEISQVYNNLGLIYQKKKQGNKAAYYFKKSLDIKKEIGDKTGQASVYTNLATLFIEKGDYERALRYLKKAEKIALQIGSKEYLKNIYNNYATVYEKLGDFKNAYKYEEKYVEIKDSLITEEMQKQLLTLQTKYETEQKEQEIKLQKTKLAKVEAENKQKALKLEKERLLRIVLSVGFLILVIGILFIYRSYRQKRKLSEELVRRNQIIETKNNKLNQLVNEIERQKQHIELIHKELSESIDYAKRLQTSILPDEIILKKNINDYFILFKPRDKVSGDFYWWTQVEDFTIITVADCTGHGVPGAFMSMLGMSFLREIVEKEYITHSGIILKRLRKEIIKALKQKGIPGEQKDGMDMSLISINHTKNEILFSGANNPLYIVTDEELQLLSEYKNPIKKFNKEVNNLKLFEIKPDKMPIAIYERMDNFSTAKIKYKKGDKLYLFSDGYADQFGGSDGKKFKYKAFKELILNTATLSMNEQKIKLEKKFLEWKNGYAQIDDVTVMGIEI